MVTTMCSARCLVAGLAIAGIVGASDASAQATRVDSAKVPASRGLAPVVVTAQRQEQDIQHAPVSISVLSGKDIRDAGMTRPQDLTFAVPGLQIGELNGGAAMLYMRGVGNVAAASFQDPTVTFNYDGVYLARPTAASGLFYDLERVEVLKGPQGTLYGRNATGGAINILPRRPMLKTVAGEVAAAYGQYDNQNVEGWFNAPLGDRAAVRVAGQRLGHSAYMKDGTDDRNDWAARAALRFDSQSISLRVGADYYEQHGHGAGATPLALGADARVGVGSPEGGAYYQSQRVTIAGRNWTPTPAMQRSNNQHWGANATIEWRTAAGALTLVPASRTSDIDGTNTAVGNLYLFKEHSRQTSLETRLASNPYARIHTLIGAFYFDEDIDLYTRPYNQFNVSFQHPLMGVTSLAPFGRVTLDVTKTLRATAGARYTHENKDFRGTLESFNRNCLPIPAASCPNAQPFPADIATAPLTFPSGSLTATPVANPADGTLTTGSRTIANEKATFSRTTWRAGLEYDLAAQVFLYGGYETGFKSGGFFFSNDSEIYQPEQVGAFTLGLKTHLLDYRLLANIELFDWRYTDQQVGRVAFDSRGLTSLRTDNIGQATIRGAESNLEYALGANTLLSANAQYLHAVYDSYSYVNFGPPTSGCDKAPAPSPNSFLVNCSGKRAPYAPEWTVAGEASQTFPLASGARLVAATRAHYQSRTLMGLDFLEQQQQDAYVTVDGSLTFTTAEDRYTVALFGQNVTDKAVVSVVAVRPTRPRQRLWRRRTIWRTVRR